MSKKNKPVSSQIMHAINKPVQQIRQPVQQVQKPQQNIAAIPLVSIIIPMYNSERYIESCVSSALNQTLKNIEIICVDDCSTDKTFNIVMELAKKDNRIRLAKLGQNSGTASEPRNLGIRLSRGKYIAFLDSDDMYTKTAMEELVIVAEKWKADVVHTEQVYRPENDVIDVDENTKLTTFSKELGGFCTEPLLETDNLVERVQMFFKDRFFGWIHNKLYRRDFLMEKDLKFAPLKISEDIIFYFFVICTAPRIVRVPNIMYIYRENENSLTRKEVSLEESFHALTQLMIEGSKLLDEFMAKIPMFVQNPALRQLPLDHLIQKHLSWTQRFYEQCKPLELDALARKEMETYCGENMPFFAYLYNTIHFYRHKLLEYEKTIKELKATQTKVQ